MSRAQRKGEPSKVKEDPIDPFIRSLVGWKADREARLLVKLLGYGKRGAPASGLSPGEARLTVTGKWYAVPFKGSDVIKVIG